MINNLQQRLFGVWQHRSPGGSFVNFECESGLPTVIHCTDAHQSSAHTGSQTRYEPQQRDCSICAWGDDSQACEESWQCGRKDPNLTCPSVCTHSCKVALVVGMTEGIAKERELMNQLCFLILGTPKVFDLSTFESSAKMVCFCAGRCHSVMLTVIEARLPVVQSCTIKLLQAEKRRRQEASCLNAVTSKFPLFATASMLHR